MTTDSGNLVIKFIKVKPYKRNKRSTEVGRID